MTMRGTPIARCPYCGTTVLVTHYDKHVAGCRPVLPTHSKPYSFHQDALQRDDSVEVGGIDQRESSPKRGTGLLVCPICQMEVRSGVLNGHLRRDHNIEKRATTEALFDELETYALEEDIYYFEPRFGDKYVGQVFPQSDGSYGSIPLYDDYSDEADAD